VAASDAPSTPILHEVQQGDERLSLEPMKFPGESLPTKGDLILAPGRVLHQPEREVTVIRRGRMNYVEREELVRLHPDDASSAGVKEGERVRITGPDGGVLAEGTASLDSPQPGLVNVTTLFAEIASAMEDSQDPDPSPRVPGLSLKRVKLAKVPARREAEVAAD
jgi:predicted molibdopterin-dependent oxidoreductase YjgC